MSDLAHLGFAIETSGLKKGEKSLDSFTQSGNKAEKATESLSAAQTKSSKVMAAQAKSTDAMAKSTGKMGKKVGMASIQVEQLIGSISGGQNPMKAFAFQAADMGIVLGAPLIGSIVGVAASLSSIFLPALIESITGTKDFSADVKQLKDNLDELADLGQRRLSSVQFAATEESNKKLKESIALTKEIKELESQRLKLTNATKPKLDLNSYRFSPLAGAGSGTGDMGLVQAQLKRTNETLRVRRATLEEVNEELKKQNDLAFAAGDQLKAIADTGKTITKDDKEALIAKNKLIENVTNSLQGQVIALRDGAKAAAEFTIVQRLGLKDGEKIPKAIQDQIDAIDELTKAKKDTKKEDKDFSSTISNINSIGSAWQGAAGDAVSSIGDIMQASERYKKQMESLGGAGGLNGILAGAGLLTAGVGAIITLGDILHGSGFDLEKLQSKQGAGTLLGDSKGKSNSLASSFETFADIQSDQLSELVMLNRSFFDLSSALTGVIKTSLSAGGFATVDLGKQAKNQGIRVGGGAIGNLGASSFADFKKVSGGSTFRAREASAEMAAVVNATFSEIAKTTEDSAKLLGFDVESSIADYVIKAFEISTKGLSAEERQKAFNDEFSKQADLLVESAIDLEKWQNVGEGAFETLTRLATEQAQYTNSVEMMGSALDDAFNIDEAQAVIAYAGGIAEFNSLATSFANDFLSTSEQLDFAGKNINDTLSELGYGGLELSNEAFKGLVQSIDRTSEEGQKLYVDLLQLAPAFADFTKETNALNNERLSLEADLLEAQGNATDAIAIRRNMELEAMDDTLHALQQQVWAEQDRKKAIDESNATLNSVVSNIRGALGQDKVSLSDALAAAKAGNFKAAQGLNASALSNLSDAGFKSVQEMQFQQAINRSQLNEIANMAEGRLTDTQKQTNILAEINTGIEALVDASNPATSGGFVGNATTTDSESSELKEMLEMIMNSTASTAKWSSQTASNTQKIYYDGIPVEVESA